MFLLPDGRGRRYTVSSRQTAGQVEVTMKGPTAYAGTSTLIHELRLGGYDQSTCLAWAEPASGILVQGSDTPPMPPIKSWRGQQCRPRSHEPTPTRPLPRRCNSSSPRAMAMYMCAVNYVHVSRLHEAPAYYAQIPTVWRRSVLLGIARRPEHTAHPLSSPACL